MNNNPIAHSLEDVAEAVNKRRLLGGFLSPARITSTRNYTGSGPVQAEGESKEFRPNSAKALLIMGLTGTLLAALFTQTAGQDSSKLLLLPLLSGMLVTGVALLIVRLVIPRFTIRLDRSGIAIDDAFFPWKQLRETAILRVRRGKHTKRYLVLWLQDGSYETYDLAAFFRFRIGGFSSVLSSYIEYFKGAQK